MGIGFFIFLIVLFVAQGMIFFAKGSTNLSRALYLTLVGVEVFLVVGLRDFTVGVDSRSYYNTFLQIASLTDLSLFDTYMETGYVLYNRFLGFISANPQILFIVTAAFVSFAAMRLIYKNTKNPVLAIFIFITLEQMLFYMTGMRQAIAAGFVFFAYQACTQRRLLLFLLFTALGMSFHTSAGIFLLAYPLYNVRLSMPIVFGVLGGAAGAFALFSAFTDIMFYIMPSYAAYGDMFYFERDAKIASYFKTFIAFAIFLLAWGAYLTNKVNFRTWPLNIQKNYNLLMFFALFSFCIFFVSIKSTIVERLALYFSFFYIIIIPQALRLIRNAHIRFMCILMVCLCCFAYFMIVLVYRPEWWGVTPYTFFFEG